MNKTYINTNERFDEDITRLQALNPDFDKSTLIRFAVRLAANTGAILGMTNNAIEIVTPMAVQARKEKVPKEDWCRSFGGEVKDGVCQIYKYETLVTGHVSKQFRTIPMSAFPIDRDEFRKSVIGHYDTLEDADAAWKAKPID